MNFQQLRIIRETVRRDFNLTGVADALFTSQSGVSKHIRDLEYELGLEIFRRRGKRLLGLTDAGREVAAIVDRMLRDAQNLRALAEHLRSEDEGQLTVATTHAQARFVLPPVIGRFKQRFPKVHLKLHQSSPLEAATLVLDGQADIAIATDSLDGERDLVAFEFHRWHHSVVVPKGHPLAAAGAVTLEAIAQHPIITYHEGFSGRASIDAAFATAGLQLNVVMSAIDADVVKTYVELGLGIGIIASIAFDPHRDAGLEMLDGSRLFAEKITRIGLHRRHYLRGFAYDFIRLCAPSLDVETVRESLLKATADA
jgi:LysR family cys regulon transcriptional activator